MAIEIVDLPIQNGDVIHSLFVYQAFGMRSSPLGELGELGELLALHPIHPPFFLMNSSWLSWQSPDEFHHHPVPVVTCQVCLWDSRNFSGPEVKLEDHFFFIISGVEHFLWGVERWTSWIPKLDGIIKPLGFPRIIRLESETRKLGGHRGSSEIWRTPPNFIVWNLKPHVSQ